jgi:hypothetical protein
MFNPQLGASLHLCLLQLFCARLDSSQFLEVGARHAALAAFGSRQRVGYAACHRADFEQQHFQKHDQDGVVIHSRSQRCSSHRMGDMELLAAHLGVGEVLQDGARFRASAGFGARLAACHDAWCRTFLVFDKLRAR